MALDPSIMLGMMLNESGVGALLVATQNVSNVYGGSIINYECSSREKSHGHFARMYN